MFQIVNFFSYFYMATAVIETSHNVDVLIYYQDYAGSDNCKMYANVIFQRNKLGNTYSATLGLLDI